MFIFYSFQTQNYDNFLIYQNILAIYFKKKLLYEYSLLYIVFAHVPY